MSGISREKLEARHKLLVRERDQLFANLNAYNGAIEQVSVLLAELDEPEQRANGKDEGADIAPLSAPD